MNTADHAILATGAAVALAGLLRSRPLEQLQRAAIYARAAGFLIPQLIEGARLRLARWPECLDRARKL